MYNFDFENSDEPLVPPPDLVPPFDEIVVHTFTPVAPSLLAQHHASPPFGMAAVDSSGPLVPSPDWMPFDAVVTDSSPSLPEVTVTPPSPCHQDFQVPLTDPSQYALRSQFDVALAQQTLPLTQGRHPSAIHMIADCWRNLSEAEKQARRNDDAEEQYRQRHGRPRFQRRCPVCDKRFF